MTRIVSRAESWERAYQAFQQVNFSSFDYNTVKQSMLDYIKLYFPEEFNDYIESSEFIAILELFAYFAELTAYRLDLNAHENFISTAERKESVLRLAKLVSYKASRNIPARGLVKISSIQTTEAVIDSAGRNLSGRRIFWNDSNNPDWKEQFLLVMNRVLEQEFGSVTPDERVQVDDVLFELYTWSNNPIQPGGVSVFTYSTSVAGDNFPMELVPTELTENGPIEKRPEKDAQFTILYGSDGLGDGSDATGFFTLTKQGTIQFITRTFDGITPNQTLDIEVININDTDVWLNNVNPDTGEIIVNDPNAEITPHLTTEGKRYGEWVEVDLANAQNIIFNTNSNRQKFETETLDDDQVRIIFGDGEFADIPKGTFDIWYRVSANTEIAIPRNAVVDQVSSFTYQGIDGNVQTLTFTYSLISSLLNGGPSEDIDRIRRAAPSVYYTQDRMVNGRDYNEFLLQDPTILKLRTINRTFAGDSKYISWFDPSESYDNAKIFGDDIALYWEEKNPLDGGLVVVSTAVSPSTLLIDFIEPLLSTPDFFAVQAPIFEAEGKSPADIRRVFNNELLSFDPLQVLGETDAILNALSIPSVTTVELWYSVRYDEWTVGQHPWDITSPLPSHPNYSEFVSKGTPESIYMITVEAVYSGPDIAGWDIRYRTKKLIAHSEETRFWNTNEGDQVITFDSFDTNPDQIVLLQANVNSNGDGLFSENKNYDVLSQALVEQNLPNAGLRDIHRLIIQPIDTNEDNIPDNLAQTTIFNYDEEKPLSEWNPVGNTITLPQTNRTLNWVAGNESTDVRVYLNGVLLPFTEGSPLASNSWTAPQSSIIRNQIQFTTTPGSPALVRIVLVDYVYLARDSSVDPYVPVAATNENKTLWALDDTLIDDERRYIRFEGRNPFNFAWFHFTPDFHLIDPSATNIHDMYIVTVGYYTALVRWLENRTDVVPEQPTSLELRTSYADLLDNRMISDTVILHSGNFKILFGSRAEPALRAVFKVIRPADDVQRTLTNNEVKVRIVEIIKSFFDVNQWEFGETFYFTELAASIHRDLGSEIDSVVLVPTFAQNQFGDLFEIPAREDELFIPDINTVDIEIVQAYTSDNIRQNES